LRRACGVEHGRDRRAVFGDGELLGGKPRYQFPVGIQRNKPCCDNRERCDVNIEQIEPLRGGWLWHQQE